MKILLVSEYFPPDQVGASRRTSILLNSLAKKYDLTLLTASPHYPGRKSDVKWYKPISIEYKNKYKIIRFWMPTIPVISSFGRILNYLIFSIFASFVVLFTGKHDIIWGTSPNVFTFFPLNVYKIIYNSNSIINIDDLWPNAPIELGFLRNETLKKIGKKISLISIYTSDGISVISEGIRDYIMKLDFTSSPLGVVYVGIENERLHEFENSSKKIDTNKSKKFTYMYTGKLGPAYDFELMISSFSKWYSKNQSILNRDVELMIRGTGPELQNIYKELLKNKDIPIKLSTKYLDDPDYDKLLRSANCFILPMKNNFISKTAIPTKLLEYISTGKPVLAISMGEPKRIVRDSKSGIICSFEEDQIIEAYQNLYENPEKFHDPGYQIDFIKQYFTERNILLQSERLIQKIL